VLKDTPLGCAVVRAALCRPTLAYIIPIHNNPTGATLPLCKRQRLVQLSHMHGFLIVADEVYQLLSFPGAPPPPPPMREVERAMHAAGALQQDGGGRSICSSVVSLGSFSKINSPGLRLGWCDAAAPQLLKLRADGVLGSGGSIAPLASGIAHSLLQLGSLQEHLHGTIRPSLEHNCAALCDALEQHLPPGCSFQRPQGGYFVWVKLPQQVRSGVAGGGPAVWHGCHASSQPRARCKTAWLVAHIVAAAAAAAAAADVC
jgi:DNA-binding transcriptional MocR family regulator